MPTKTLVTQPGSEIPLLKHEVREAECPEGHPKPQNVPEGSKFGHFDDLLQRLFAIRMHLSLALEAVEAGDSGKAKEDLQLLEALVTDTIRLTRFMYVEQGFDDGDKISVAMQTARWDESI